MRRGRGAKERKQRAEDQGKGGPRELMVKMTGLYRNEKLGEGEPMSWRRRGQVEKSQDANMDSVTGTCNA